MTSMPLLPEIGIVDIDAYPRQEPIGIIRIASRQQIEILRHKARALFLIELVQRQHQQLAEGVSIDIAGRMQKSGAHNSTNCHTRR